MIHDPVIANTDPVDTRALTSLLTVADTGSFSRAAALLGFTQSAVSQHVAGIERAAGTPLLTRRPTVGPTAAGHEFLRHARQILAHERAAHAAVRRLAGGADDAPIAVALTPGTERLLPAGQPIAVVHVLDPDRAAAALAAGDVELAIVDGLAAPGDPLRGAGPDIETRLLAETPAGVLLPGDHPLARRPGLDLADLTEARWLATARTAELAAVTRLTLRRGTAYDGESAGTVAALVRAGHGLAPAPLAEPIPEGLVAVPLTAPRLVHRTEARIHTTARAAVRAAADTVTV